MVIEPRDESIGFIAKGYEAMNIDGNVYYVRDCEVEIKEVSENEKHVIKTCIDVNGNIVKFLRRLIYENGIFKKAERWKVIS